MKLTDIVQLNEAEVDAAFLQKVKAALSKAQTGGTGATASGAEGDGTRGGQPAGTGTAANQGAGQPTGAAGSQFAKPDNLPAGEHKVLGQFATQDEAMLKANLVKRRQPNFTYKVLPQEDGSYVVAQQTNDAAAAQERPDPTGRIQNDY
jgi:hypothetical protein